MRNPDFNKVLTEAKALHDKKNNDYAGADEPLANLKDCTLLGLPPVMGIVIRLLDKFRRLRNFCLNKKLMCESVRETFMDIGIYCFLAIVILDQEAEQGQDKEGFDDLTTNE